MPEIRMIPVDLIDPHPHNPRRDLGDLTELRRRHAALTPFALRFLSNGPGGEPFIALACEDGTPLPEPAFDAVLLFAELAAVELPALLDAAEESDALRAERDALAEAVERVRALHVEEHVYIGPSDPIGGFICRACGEPVESEPCPTIRVLDGEADHE